MCLLFGVMNYESPLAHRQSRVKALLPTTLGRTRQDEAMNERVGSRTDCIACQLASGEAPLPGGTIHRTDHWTIEHCIGPLGVGTLIAKPLRHVLHVSDLAEDESAELGPLLRDATRACSALTNAEQVYVCLWSHAAGRPGHIHFVVQPVTAQQMQEFGAYGPALQMVMFTSGDSPDADAVARFSDSARAWFAKHRTR